MFLLGEDFFTSCVDIARQGCVRFNEVEAALGVCLLELGQEGCSAGLAAADDVRCRAVGVSGELAQSALANATCAADEQGSYVGDCPEAGVCCLDGF